MNFWHGQSAVVTCYIAGVDVEWPLMKVIITFTFCCNNLWKNKYTALKKSPENSGNFFSYFVAPWWDLQASQAWWVTIADWPLYRHCKIPRLTTFRGQLLTHILTVLPAHYKHHRKNLHHIILYHWCWPNRKSAIDGFPGEIIFRTSAKFPDNSRFFKHVVFSPDRLHKSQQHKRQLSSFGIQLLHWQQMQWATSLFGRSSMSAFQCFYTWTILATITLKCSQL